MKKFTLLFCVTLTATALGCSAQSDNKFGSSGGTNAGGKTSSSDPEMPADIGAVHDTGLTVDGLPDGGVADAACGLFCPLTPYCAGGDPCCKAFPWVTNVPVDIVAGTNTDLVQYQGRVYRWIGKDPLTYTQEACVPTTTVEWCTLNWRLTDTICPIIDITADSGT
jgi:hypothetical protein